MNFNPITGGGGFVGSVAGYIPFAGADGSLTDEAHLAFDATSDQLRVGKSIRLVEMASAPTAAATYGYLWVKNTTPTSLIFTTDAGTDIDLSAGSPNNSLDNAYDQGGAGMGRTITVDSGPVQLNASVQGALGIALATTLSISGISITEDNVVRTAPMIELTRQALATGPMINLVPGAATVAALRVNGGKIDLSIAGDLGEYIFSGEDGYIDLVAAISRFSGSLKLAELAAAPADTAAYGQYWVKSDTPNVPMFTDDAGTDHYLGSLTGTGTDNHIIRFDGTANLQDSLLTIADTTGAISAVGVELTLAPATLYGVTIVPVASTVSSAAPNETLTITAPAHTRQSNVEHVDVLFDLGRSVGWLGDDHGVIIADQRFVYFEKPTVTSYTPGYDPELQPYTTTFTDAATVYIEGAPVAGTRAQITNAYALWVDSGDVRLDGTKLYLGANGSYVSAGGYSLSFYTPAAPENARTPIALYVVPGAHTGVYAGDEASDVRLYLDRTVTWNTGALTAQRAVYIEAPTYAFDGASTITDAATVYIAGAPAAGANATITSSWALWIDAGATRMDGTLFMLEAAAAATDIAAYGQWWVKNDIPCTPWFTDDAGTDQRVVRATSSVTITDNAIPRWDGDTGRVQSSIILIADTTGAISAGEEELMLSPATGYGVTITQAAGSDPTTPHEALTIIGGAHLGITASQPAIDVLFDLGRIVTWNTGALASQWFVYFEAPTIAFDGASVVTNAATVYIEGAPAAGANATITSSWALWIDAGATRMDGPLFMLEAAAAATDIAAYGQYWVKSDTPCTPWFTGDTGTDYQLAALNVAQAWTAGQLDTPLVVDFTGATTTIDTNARNQFYGQLSIATTALQIPTNIAAGQWFTIDVQQAAAGGKALTAVASYDWGDAGAPDFTTLAASEYATIVCHVLPDGVTIASSCSLNSSLIGTGTDNHIPRYDGTAKLQDSLLTIADTTGAISAVGVELTLAPATTFGVTITQTVAAAATPAEILTITGAAHTTVTASAEAVDVLFDLARTVQWATGAIASQRAVFFEAPTYAFVGASTITNAATVYIDGAPLAGTNATITTPSALWIALANGASNLANNGLVFTDTTNAVRTGSFIKATACALATGAMIDLTTAGPHSGVTVANNGSAYGVQVLQAGTLGGLNVYAFGELGSSHIILNEENAIRTHPMIQLVRGALATGTVIEIIPGSAVSALRVYGGKIDLSIAGDLGEYIWSNADGYITIQAPQVNIPAIASLVSATASNSIACLDNVSLYFGTGNDTRILHLNTETPDTLHWGVGAESNAVVICETADVLVTFNHALQTDPTFFFHAADATDITKWGSLSRGDDDFVIGVGAGGEGTLSFLPDSTIVKSNGSLKLAELAAAPADTAAYGQFWVKNDIPNVPMFTDDAGTDHQLAYV